MKLTDFLTGVGRPVAYYPKLARCLGSVKAAIFVCQMVYWSDKTNNPRGVYKTAEEIEEEIGLSYKEQQGARKILKQKGILTEHYERLTHRMFYLIDFNKLNDLFNEFTTSQNGYTKFPTCENPSSGVEELNSGEMGNSRVAKLSVGESPNCQLGSRQIVSSIYTENTTENTTETTNIYTADKSADTHTEKKRFLEYVFLTEEEHNKLIGILGKEQTEDYILRLNDYINQIGVQKGRAKYKSHYHTILNWHRKDKAEIERRLKVAEAMQQKRDDRYF